MSTEKEYKAAREMPGVVKMYAATTVPTGYLLCNGQAVSRTTYADLFAVIGETWGAGDSSTTFNVPDLVGAAPTGVGTSTGYTADETIALGTKYNDQFQGHRQRIQANENGISASYHLLRASVAGSTAGGVGLGASNPAVNFNTTDFLTDGTNGTPRTGTTTRGKRVGINFIIKT